VTVGICFLSISGPTSAQTWQDFSTYTTKNQDEKKIIEILRKWEKSINEKDADLHLSLFDKEARVVTRSGETYQGENRIKEMIDSYLFPVVQSFKIEQARIAIIRNNAKAS
jgi:ketosteroid isomerase-like protein